MKKIIVFAAAMAITLGSCDDSEFKGFTRAENGLHYRFFNHDEEGQKIQMGDGVLLRYVIVKHDNDSLIVDSKEVSRDGSGYTQFGMQKSSFRGSLEDGMMMMAKGDSAEFIVPADSFFLKSMQYNELPPGIHHGDYVRALFKIKDIMPATEVEEERKRQMEEQQARMKEMYDKEQPAIDAYIAEKKIKAKPTPTGLYYIELKKGTGGSPAETDVVKVHYTGRLLDGTIFDSSEGREPIEFPLNQVIPGWTEGLQLMKKGGKARLIIPSALAYGSRGGGDMIPPFAPLEFEVELLDFSKAPEQSEMPAHP
jgi:FKBP-type peptidyl-prolyl cis-trans isomerase FkpA